MSGGVLEIRLSHTTSKFLQRCAMRPSKVEVVVAHILAGGRTPARSQSRPCTTKYLRGVIWEMHLRFVEGGRTLAKIKNYRGSTYFTRSLTRPSMLAHSKLHQPVHPDGLSETLPRLWHPGGQSGWQPLSRRIIYSPRNLTRPPMMSHRNLHWPLLPDGQSRRQSPRRQLSPCCRMTIGTMLPEDNWLS